MAITLPDLPYAQDALEPHISANTLSFHHGKHHNAYVTKTNELISGTDLENVSIEEISQAAHDKGDQGLFNQAAQVWNHTFYWNSMSPNGAGEPTGDIADKIKEDFGSYEEFANAFKTAGATQFGSGWAWLVLDGGKLKVEKTPNAGTPLVEGKTPLITMDVWEHAYYLDYQNRRPDYMGAFLGSLINWDFANANLKSA
jgi:Fe-Mn family superoxide dismutase